MSSEDILDRAFLAGLCDGDKAFEDEILSLFLESAAIYLDELEASAKGDDWPRIAHKFKGAARAVGALELASLCQSAEHLVVIAERQEIHGKLGAGLDALSAYLGQEKSAP